MNTKVWGEGEDNSVEERGQLFGQQACRHWGNQERNHIRPREGRSAGISIVRKEKNFFPGI